MASSSSSEPSVKCNFPRPDDLPDNIADRIATSVERRNYALTYLKEVKDTFKDQREKYDMFMNMTKDFMAQRIDTIGVITRVKEIFKGHDNLLCGFKKLFPEGYDDLEDIPPKILELAGEAKCFINKLKERFQNDVHVYESFIDILDMCCRKRKSTTEFYHEVAPLFDGHPDLLDEFSRFFPVSSAVASTHQALAGETSSVDDFDPLSNL